MRKEKYRKYICTYKSTDLYYYFYNVTKIYKAIHREKRRRINC